jgi:predicted ATPase
VPFSTSTAATASKIRSAYFTDFIFVETKTFLAIIIFLHSLFINRNITIFVGENGSGKSTMLEAIAVNYGFNPEGGTKNYNYLGLG